MWIIINAIFFLEIIIILWILYLLNRTWKMEEWNRQMRSYMFSMRELFVIQKRRIDAIRKYRHDLANHIRTLEYMKKRQDGMDDYLAYVKESYQKLEAEQYCEDEVINSVLAIKGQQCKKYSIQWMADIQVEHCRVFSDYDMAGLLNNLLDNAMEANERITDSSKRWIRLSLKKERERLILKLENPLNEGEIIVFETKKKKKDEHGLGRKIIEDIVRKYDGVDEIHHNKEENIMSEIMIFPVKTDWDGKD